MALSDVEVWAYRTPDGSIAIRTADSQLVLAEDGARDLDSQLHVLFASPAPEDD